MCAMWFFRVLSFLLILHIIRSDELTEKNETEILAAKNNSFDYQRISEPLAQTQNVEQSSGNQTEKKSFSDFRPSPHLETFVEFNKFPVPPALPEAKHFSALNFGETPSAWPERTLTTEQSWSTRIKFPTTSSSPPVIKAKDRPYEFYNEDKSFNGKSYSVPIKSEMFLSKPYMKKPSEDAWSKYLEYEKKAQIVQKNQFDFTAPVEKAPVYGVGPSSQKFDFGGVEKTAGHDISANPWKKIVKFLTAFIPIGLLISALTPTVITVQSMNGTQLRSRAVDPKNPTDKKLISSLNYFNSIGCEDRILCELILSASNSQNAEQHVDNLLNTFTKNGRAVEKAEEMRKILEAVKKQDCRSIVCTSMKEKT